MPLKCQIITQEREVFNEDVDIVIAPSIEGEMGVLPNHAPLIAALDFGELVIRQNDVEQAFAIGGGVLEVANNNVRVLADSAEHVDEIDIARAEQARQRARKTMEEGTPADPDKYAALEAAIRRANLRLKVARKHREGRRTPSGPSAMDFDRDE